MDRNFLEFWGNYLIGVAKGQKQMEDLNKWILQGFKGFEDLTNLFRKAYDLDKVQEDSPDHLKMWQNAEESFRKSFTEYLNLFGFVPRETHLDLVKKYEELKKKCETQEETIKHLRMLLEGKGMDYGEMSIEFQDLVKKQSEQFQKMMESFGKIFEKKEPPTDTEE